MKPLIKGAGGTVSWAEQWGASCGFPVQHAVLGAGLAPIPARDFSTSGLCISEAACYLGLPALQLRFSDVDLIQPPHVRDVLLSMPLQGLMLLLNSLIYSPGDETLSRCGKISDQSESWMCTKLSFRESVGPAVSLTLHLGSRHIGLRHLS